MQLDYILRNTEIGTPKSPKLQQIKQINDFDRYLKNLKKQLNK